MVNTPAAKNCRNAVAYRFGHIAKLRRKDALNYLLSLETFRTKKPFFPTFEQYF